MRAAGALAGSGLQGLQAQRDILGAQMSAGETERALTQADLDAAYNEYLAEMQFPLTQFGVLSGGGQAFLPGSVARLQLLEILWVHSEWVCKLLAALVWAA